MSIVLTVTPEVLKKKSSEISAEIKKVDTMMKNINETILATKKYWQGDASDMHQKHYNKFKDDISKVIKQLEEHPVDLLKMANLYDKAEDTNIKLANKLPSNVIK